MRQLADPEFIRQATPVIFLGEPGNWQDAPSNWAGGRSGAAAALGHSVRFVTAAALVTELVEAKNAHDQGRVVGRYSRCDLLIVDELGYLPLAAFDAELLFSLAHSSAIDVGSMRRPVREPRTVSAARRGLVGSGLAFQSL